MDCSVLDDSQLILLLRQNSEDALSEIYNRYWKLLFYTANNILQNRTASQDIVQEVFIDLWQRREKTEVQSLKAYLQQAARFQVLKAIRAEKTDQQFYSRLAEITASIVYENPSLLKEQEALLQNTLNGLPEDCSLIFRLSREEHLTYKQIAGKLEISEKTVEKKMTICLKHIRQVLLQHPGPAAFLLFSYYSN